MNYFLVFIGGGMGSLVRYGIARLFSKYFPFFPMGTLVANLLGMFLIGVLAVLIIDKAMLVSPYREMILVGFLGGLTTFSSFGYESFMLIVNARFWDLFLYLVGNIGVGFFLLILGRVLGNL